MIRRKGKVAFLALALLSARLEAAEVAATFNPMHAFPASGAAHVCPDTPLRLVFPAPPRLGTGGKIQIFDAADDSVVESIEVSSPTATKAIGGLPNYNYYPVIITDRTATIYPKNHALSYSKSYYVTVDAGAFTDQAGAASSPGLDRATAWHFSTKPAPPVAGTSRLVVAADGSGDFCTVQGAIDFIPEGNTTPTTVFVRKGTYTEMVFFTNKHALTVLGEDRQQTVIAYATNERFNPAGGNPYATGNNPSAVGVDQHSRIYHRGVFLAHRVEDLVIANLTIRNTTPQGGSQAEAIILNGTPTARAIIKDVDFYSFQDTIQLNGQAYVNNCYIEGDVDFMWGTGPGFFKSCTARALRSGAYYTQIRNPGTNHGFVYDHCVFDGAPGVTGNYLSRISPARFPNSEVVLLECTLGSSANAPGWLLEKNPNAPTGTAGSIDPANIHFWEYNSRTADGQPIDASQRLPASRQLKQPDDDATITSYRDPVFVLGHDWNPRLAPIFR